MQLKPGTELLNGKYRIVNTLGQGGFGITYGAVQVALHRKVAIKEFFMKDCCERDEATCRVTIGTGSQRNLVEKFRGKFIREAQMIASFIHPNIVRVIDVFEENDTAYYVMEDLLGGSLANKVRMEGPLSETQAEKYIRQVADALAYIHSQNTVHLDVKPSNVLLNANGDAVLIDFGISKHYDESGEQTSSTPIGISKGFAPLEQGRDGDVTQFKPSTDIYALGATLYNLLSGKIPPEASAVYEDGLERPEGISDRMWLIIYHAMQPRRKDRLQSIQAFLSLIDNQSAAHVLEQNKDKVSFRSQEQKGDERTEFINRNVSFPSENDTEIQADEEYSPVTLYLLVLVGLAVLAYLIYLFVELEEWVFDFYFLLAFIGTVFAGAGVVCLFNKWRIGFGALITGGFLAIIMDAAWTTMHEYLIQEVLERAPFLLVLCLFTYGILQIKNKNGVSGWKLLRLGFPWSYQRHTR